MRLAHPALALIELSMVRVVRSQSPVLSFSLERELVLGLAGTLIVVEVIPASHGRCGLRPVASLVGVRDGFRVRGR